MRIDKLAMRQGYKEMANINLAIVQESFHLETEGEQRVYEMVKKERKS